MPYEADPEKEAKSAKEKEELLVKLDGYFSYALDHPSWIDARKEMIRCFQYCEGNQWTKEELAILEERGQPPTVNNQVSVTVSTLMGQLTEQQYRIGFRGRNDAEDKAGADALTDVFLYVRQSNDLEFEETDMAADGFTSGAGVLAVRVEFDDLYQPEIKIQHEDVLSVYPDPDSRRYDWNEDANFVATAKWFPLEDVVAKYPKAKAELEGLVSDEQTGMGSQISSVDAFKNANYVDCERRKIRLVTMEYKKPVRECIYLIDGQTVQEEEGKELVKDLEEGVDYEKIERLKKKLCTAVFTSRILLEHKVTRNKYYSLIPYWVYRKKNGAPYGPISLALTMQDAINKRESKALHLLNSNQTIAERGAITDKDLYQEEIHKPDGVATVEDGALAQEKILLRNNLELAQSQFAMHGASKEDYYRITGVDPRIAQNTQEIRSAAGLKRKFSESNKPVARLFSNLRRTRKITGRVVLERVQNYFTKEKTLLITDSEEKSRVVNLTVPLLQKIKSAQYDVVASDFADTETLQQEQWALLLQYVPQLQQLGPFWMKKMILMSDLRDKNEFAKEIEEQGKPPPTEPKISINATIDQLPPMERAFYYDKMGAPQVAQWVRENAPETTQELKSKTEIEKELIKKQVPESQDQSQVEVERQKGENEKIKGQVAQMKGQVDLQKGQLALEKGRMDIQKEVIKAAAPEKTKNEESEE